MRLYHKLRWLALQGFANHRWYEVALNECLCVCGRENWQLEKFIVALAAFSPRCKVSRCAKRAIAWVNDGTILQDVPGSVRLSIAHLERSGNLRGWKTRTFARAIGGDGNAIVLDTHMAAALKCPHEIITRADCRLLAERLIRAVSIRIGLSPRNCQAAIWSGHLLSTGRQPAGPSILAAYDEWITNGRRFNR